MISSSSYHLTSMLPWARLCLKYMLNISKFEMYYKYSKTVCWGKKHQLVWMQMSLCSPIRKFSCFRLNWVLEIEETLMSGEIGLLVFLLWEKLSTISLLSLPLLYHAPTKLHSIWSNQSCVSSQLWWLGMWTELCRLGPHCTPTRDQFSLGKLHH